MKSIRSKLNDSQGVSIIIALVFMLVCLFVGGTVLTAATVNAGRMRKKENSREFMDYRSAAILLSDEMKTSDNQLLRLDIIKEEIKTEDVFIKTNGKIKETTSSSTRNATRFVVSHDLTNTDIVSPLQRMVIETAVRKYQAQNGGVVSIEYTKVNGMKATLQEPDFMIPKFTDEGQKVSAVLSVELKEEGQTDFNEHCQVNCIVENNDFIIKLWNDEYKIAMDVRMDASTSTKKVPDLVEIFSDNNYEGSTTTGKRYTTKQDITSIVWHGPVITKPVVKAPVVQTPEGGI